MLNDTLILECYAIHSGDPEVKEALGYCVVGKGELFSGITLEEAKALASLTYPDANFKENCGWILPHEEETLRQSTVKIFGIF